MSDNKADQIIFQHISSTLKSGEQPGSHARIARATGLAPATVSRAIASICEIGWIIKHPTEGKYTPTEYSMPGTPDPGGGATGRAAAADAPLAGAPAIDERNPQTLRTGIARLRSKLSERNEELIKRLADAQTRREYDNLRTEYNSKMQQTQSLGYQAIIKAASALYYERHPEDPHSRDWLLRHTERGLSIPAPSCPICELPHNPLNITEPCPACKEGL